jgi:shikimate kinase/3-dehydroquinate synthase
MRSAPPTLLLTGFMGTGKSTVGHLVAERAGVPFEDLDERVEHEAGRTIAELFAAEGEPAFRAREAAALEAVLAAGGRRVVALGGGALLDRSRRRSALERATVVTLSARAATIVARTSGPSRPLLEGHADRRARVEALLAERAGAYSEAHACVATDDRDPADVADEVLAAWATPTVPVPLGVRSYGVRIASDVPAVVARLARHADPSRVFVVTDTTVAPLWSGPLLAALEGAGLLIGPLVALAPGEPNKQLAGIEAALRLMVEAGADRDALVIALGGGVVNDMAGFAAATLLRGVRWLTVPTTLLAMVDASVGGKTGVDLGAAKNAVGAFHQPLGVVTGPRFVTTETRRNYVSGLAEVVKSAAIGDEALFAHLEAHAVPALARSPEAVEQLVLGSVAVKAGIVARDERESGERMLLNFGHTIGHALEAEGGFSALTHGEAVSLGMVAALRAGVALGITPEALAARVIALLERLELPTDLSSAPLRSALRWVGLDKKRRSGALRFVALRALGDAVVRATTTAELAASLGVSP